MSKNATLGIGVQPKLAMSRPWPCLEEGGGGGREKRPSRLGSVEDRIHARLLGHIVGVQRPWNAPHPELLDANQGCLYIYIYIYVYEPASKLLARGAFIPTLGRPVSFFFSGFGVSIFWTSRIVFPETHKNNKYMKHSYIK